MKRLLTLFFALITSISCSLAQTDFTWLHSKVIDSTKVTKPSGWGTMYYNFQSNKWKVVENGVTYDLKKFGGGGGIANSALNDEVGKSNGTNIVGTGIFNPSSGNITLGSGSISGSRNISVSSSTANANLTLVPQGTGQTIVGTNSSGAILVLGRSTDGSTSNTITVDGSNSNVGIGLISKGAGGVTLNAGGNVNIFSGSGIDIAGATISGSPTNAFRLWADASNSYHPTIKLPSGTVVDLLAGGGGNPFADNTAILKNNSDNTKLLKFDLSAFTTSTTNTLTPPNYSGTIATLNGTETLTNKNIVGDGNSSHFLNGTGAYSTPAGGSSSGFIGNIYSENFSGTLAAYTNSGGGTAAISGGVLQLSGGSGTYTKVLIRTASITSTNNHYRTLQFKSTGNATAEGIGNGWYGVNLEGSLASIFATINTAAVTNRGQLIIEVKAANGTVSVLATSATNLSYTNSTDLIEIGIRVNGQRVDAYLRNLTTLTPDVLCSYNGSWGGAQLLNVLSSPAIYIIGGTQNVSLDAWGSHNKKNPRLVVLGNSIMAGYWAGAEPAVMSNILAMNITGGVINFASGSNTLDDMIASFNDVVLAAPEYALICEGTNDAIASIATGNLATPGTYIYKLNTLIQLCLTNGVKPIILNSPPVGSAYTNAATVQGFIDGYNTAITSVFGNSFPVIDISTGLKNGGSFLDASFDYGDHAHLNATGNAYMAKTVLANISFINTAAVNSLSYLTPLTVSSSIDNLNFGWTQNWSMLTNGNGLSLTSNSTAVTNNGTVLNVSTSGANVANGTTSYAAQFTNSRTGTTPTDYAATFTASGTGTNIGALFTANGSATLNTAATFTASGGTTNYALTTTAGRVAINSTVTTTSNDIMAVWAAGSGTSIPLTVVGDVSSRNLLLKDVTNAAANTGNGIFFQVKGAAAISQLQSLSNIGSATIAPFLLLTTTLSIGTGQSTGTSLLHLQAGTTSVAPFGMTSGPFLTSPVNGKGEYDGINLAFTPASTTRKIVSLYQTARSTAQTAAVASVVAWTVGANDGSFLVSSNVNLTASTTNSFTVTCTYTDETNTSRTETFSFTQNGAAVPIQTITNTTGVGAYSSTPLHIRCKAATSITIATTGTFTSVTYNVEGAIAQIN